MTREIFTAPEFDITVTASRDYRGRDNYIIRYGLQVETAASLLGAKNAFNSCVDHAMQCKGVFDNDL